MLIFSSMWTAVDNIFIHTITHTCILYTVTVLVLENSASCVFTIMFVSVVCVCYLLMPTCTVLLLVKTNK